MKYFTNTKDSTILFGWNIKERLHELENFDIDNQMSNILESRGGNSIENNNHSYGSIKPGNSGVSFWGGKQMAKE